MYALKESKVAVHLEQRERGSGAGGDTVVVAQDEVNRGPLDCDENFESYSA